MPDPIEDTPPASEITVQDDVVNDDTPEAEDTDNDGEVTTGQESDEEDPIEALVQARLSLERERMVAEAHAEQEARSAAEQQRLRATAEREALRSSFETAIKTARDKLKSVKVKNEDGDDVVINLPDDFFEEAVAKPFQAHNANVREVVQADVLNALADAALNTLPDSSREDFITKATAKPLTEWLQTYAETQAPNTQFVKTLQREVDVQVKAATARGFAR